MYQAEILEDKAYVCSVYILDEFQKNTSERNSVFAPVDSLLTYIFVSACSLVYI